MSTQSRKSPVINLLIHPIVWERIDYFQHIKKAVLYFEEHLSDRIGAEVIAEEVGLERTAFSKTFKRTIGITFREFAEAVRISRAVEEMAKSDQSLTEIALVAGFLSLTNFERAFRKRFRVSPSTYRKALLKHKRLTAETNSPVVTRIDEARVSTGENAPAFYACSTEATCEVASL